MAALGGKRCSRAEKSVSDSCIGQETLQQKLKRACRMAASGRKRCSRAEKRAAGGYTGQNMREPPHLAGIVRHNLEERSRL